jgi:predicted FMN-binding regulatory protein PaiB
MEAKFKLGQNRSAADQAGMLSGLQLAGDPDSHALARFIRAQG